MENNIDQNYFFRKYCVRIIMQIQINKLAKNLMESRAI